MSTNVSMVNMIVVQIPIVSTLMVAMLVNAIPDMKSHFSIQTTARISTNVTLLITTVVTI